MGVIHIAAAVVLLLGLYGLFLHFWPYRTCWWCKKGSFLARLAGRGRCWRCHGHKLTRRWGAWHVHKAELSLRQAWDERGSDE
jgi:hypothetical protein